MLEILAVAASENGHQEEKVDEPVKEVDDQPVSETDQPQSEEATVKESDEQLSNQNGDGAQEPSKEETQAPSSEDQQQQQGNDSSAEQQQLTSDNETITRRMEVPNNKVCFLTTHFTWRLCLFIADCIWQTKFLLKVLAAYFLYFWMVHKLILNLKTQTVDVQ